MIRILAFYLTTIPCIALSSPKIGDKSQKATRPPDICVLVATPERKVKSKEMDTSKTVPGICQDTKKSIRQMQKRNVN